MISWLEGGNAANSVPPNPKSEGETRGLLELSSRNRLPVFLIHKTPRMFCTEDRIPRPPLQVEPPVRWKGKAMRWASVPPRWTGPWSPPGHPPSSCCQHRHYRSHFRAVPDHDEIMTKGTNFSCCRKLEGTRP